MTAARLRPRMRNRPASASACASNSRASLSNTAPSSVSATLRVVRVISRVPRSSSSSRMKRPSADGSMSSRCAALPKCSSSAAATKQRR
jgi:hypothetical protein